MSPQELALLMATTGTVLLALKSPRHLPQSLHPRQPRPHPRMSPLVHVPLMVTIGTAPLVSKNPQLPHLSSHRSRLPRQARISQQELAPLMVIIGIVLPVWRSQPPHPPTPPPVRTRPLQVAPSVPPMATIGTAHQALKSPRSLLVKAPIMETVMMMDTTAAKTQGSALLTVTTGIVPME